MKLPFAILLALLVSTSAALSQQKPDPAVLERTISVLEQQRNSAMNSAAIAETRLATVSEELAKAQERIKELEAKSPAPAKK